MGWSCASIQGRSGPLKSAQCSKMAHSPGPARPASSARHSRAGPSQSPTNARYAGHCGRGSPYASMSPSVGSLSRTRRAKCNCPNSPNGSSELRGSAMPGCDVIDARTLRSASSRPARTGATTVNCDWGVTTSELETEVDQALLCPVDLAEVDPGADQADLVAYPVRDEGSLRVVQNDALLAVEPAWGLVDLGDDRLYAERQNAVLERAALGVEDFPLPAKVIDDLCDRLTVFGSRCDDRRAGGGAVRNVARRARTEQIVELALGHR